MKTYGYLKYDPESKTTRKDPWWLIVNCSIGLAKLYQHLIYKDAIKNVRADNVFGLGSWLVERGKVKVNKSVWGPHISLVRGEVPTNKKFWKKYDGKRIWFEYTSMVGTNGCHYWLPVFSQEFIDIRLELGLPPEPRAPFHLTIGRDVEAPPSNRR